jgi:hypothetical protein
MTSGRLHTAEPEVRLLMRNRDRNPATRTNKMKQALAAIVCNQRRFVLTQIILQLP